VAVRWLRPQFIVGQGPVSSPFWHHDPELGFFHRPGESGTYSQPDFTHSVAINAMGFRDRERAFPAPAPGASGREGSSAEPATAGLSTPAGPPDLDAASGRGSAPRSVAHGGPGQNTFRIAVVGDSFVWGHGVEDDQVFTRLMEETLPGVEVWNLGVSAYSTDQELLLLRRFGGRILPHVIVVMISRNDFEGNVAEYFGAYHKPRFVERGDELALAGVPVPWPSAGRRALTWLRCRSALVNGFLTFLDVEAGMGGVGPGGGRDAQIRTTLKLLDEFAREASSLGARLGVGLVPMAAHVDNAEIHPGDTLRYGAVRGWGGSRGVPVLDMRPAFRRAHVESGARLYYSRDLHWTAAGHRLVAETLAGMLGEAGLLPSR
jgi:lysophospholipase L1-like esterase